MAQQGWLPKPGFEVWGVERHESEAPGQPGDPVLIDDVLHRDSPNGDEIGSATGTFTVNQGGRDADGELTLDFTDSNKSTVKAEGTLRWNPSGKFGDGTLRVKSGNVNGKPVKGKLHVKRENPKRYSHEEP